jgi:hypothetical protein
VKRNRGIVAGRLGLTESCLVTLHQYHSSDVLVVDSPWQTSVRPRADAMVTRVPGIALGVLTADCAPLLFADPGAAVIGAAHAGWKGALTGIAGNTIMAMERLGARRENIVAVVGPTISQRCYEVGPDFRQRFEVEDAAASAWFRPSQRPYHFMFDLPGYLSARLRQFGVHKVVDLALCTYADETRFFSFRRTTHRREADYGRQISAISLVE